MAAGHYPLDARERVRAAEPAARRPPARADRRADTARRAGRELLVSPAPCRVRVDRRAGGGAECPRYGLWRGLWIGGARAVSGLRGGGRRQPRGPRARPAA